MSKYVDNLRGVAEQLAAEGWDMRADIVNTAANHMERMECYIADLASELEDDFHVKKSEQ